MKEEKKNKKRRKNEYKEKKKRDKEKICMRKEYIYIYELIKIK
jgi:hypothetical protein